ncbi:MAG TPA: ATP-binding protein [Pyrinomonadaceae bacterium]|jgi:nitrogen fixation/metabolism regulation signal transduction histidine kinase
MLPRYENRMQFALALLVGLLLLANLFTLALVALTPSTRAARLPVLFTVVVITLVVSIPCILLIPRWLLRPYRQLLDEAERAPVAMRTRGDARDETEFVLQTFQEVVAQLRAQQRELEILSARERDRAVSAERFSERIVASVPSGLVAFDAQGRVTVVNAPARAILETDGEPNDVSADAGRENFQTLLRHAPELIKMVEHCLESGELYRREEVSATTGDGRRVRRLGVTVAPIDPQPERGARGALCLVTDITEVVQLREAVALKRSLESLGEMSAGLAHEFKNALATLHGYAQLLQNLELDERGRIAAAALLQEVRSLSEMVTSFLNFARPQPLELVDVSLDELITDCASELQTLYDERRITFRVEGEFASVRADERMLRQSVLNLLRNAAEAIDAESVRREVSVHGRREMDDNGRSHAVVEIRDTGAGLHEADIPRIFIPFFTTKTKGHGVGLALAHRVVTEHGGTLTAANAPNGGAIFTIHLPA